MQKLLVVAAITVCACLVRVEGYGYEGPFTAQILCQAAGCGGSPYTCPPESNGLSVVTCCFSQFEATTELAPCNTNGQYCWDPVKHPGYLQLATFCASGSNANANPRALGILSSGTCTVNPSSEDLINLSCNSHSVVSPHAGSSLYTSYPSCGLLQFADLACDIAGLTCSDGVQSAAGAADKRSKPARPISRQGSSSEEICRQPRKHYTFDACHTCLSL